MKTTTIQSSKTAIGLLGSLVLYWGCGSALAQDKWQERLLYNPPESHLRAEQQGRIMIYDGLKDTEVSAVLDSQFGRIQSMMFVGTVATDSGGEILRDKETGNVVVEDDGC
ncbi:MAG: hypothetical protein U9P11_00010 [Pseudomonadota bacterium]|nr:hypothetical protein [Pseudomonadota bacterium]